MKITTSRVVRQVWRGTTRLCSSSHSFALENRYLSTTANRRTDGVFRGLEDERLQTPWIEAWRRLQADKNHVPDTQSSVKEQERDLTPRRMSDSYQRVILPLAQDPWLSDMYLNASGQIRLGTIFMDLDALSGIIVYRHTGPGVAMVTAAVDGITISHPLTEVCDLEYSGQVTYASGRSSCEITCKVARARPSTRPATSSPEYRVGDTSAPAPEDVLLTCTFTMVALSPLTKKPIPIPAISPSTPLEHSLYQAGAHSQALQKQLSKTSVSTTAPTPLESSLIHSIYLLQARSHDPSHPFRLASNVIPMENTKLSTAAIMQPQYRNRHQTMIFGGYHLKSTFELAFCCAASFAHARPTFLSADPCTFRNPVPVGSVLYLEARVAYTDPAVLEIDEAGNEITPPLATSTTSSSSTEEGKEKGEDVTRVHIRVDSKVRAIEHGTAKSTGQFNYTFSVPKDVKVLPRTYGEYMIYIDARRRVRRGDETRERETERHRRGNETEKVGGENVTE